MARELSVLFDRKDKNIPEWRVRAKLVQVDACTWKLTYFIRGTGSHNFRRNVQRHDIPLTATRGSFPSVAEQAMHLIKDAALKLTKIEPHKLGHIASVWTLIPD